MLPRAKSLSAVTGHGRSFEHQYYAKAAGVKMFAIEDANAETRLRPRAVMAVAKLCPRMIMTIITTTR
jgi:hypothetical protein